MQAAKLILRIAGAVLGGYALSALLVALLAAALVRLGMAKGEAVVSASIAGFLIYLVLLVWAFSCVRLRTLWATLVASSTAAYGLLLLAC